MARGGARLGAGRPSKSLSQRWLDGNAGKRGPKVAKRPEGVPIGPVELPDWLNEREAAVWQANVGYALEAKTLTPATAADFAVLCVLEVEMAQALAERRAEGWTSRGLRLAREFRGLMQRVEGKRRAFRLAPMGKDMSLPEAPKDEWDEFADGPQLVKGA